jgi:hypothetical protein
LNESGLRKKLSSPKPKTPFLQKLPKKEPLGAPKNDDLKSDRYKMLCSFEPSNIFNIQNSFLWRLQNLKAWFKEQESYEDFRYLKSYSIKTNEKGHILV